MEGAETTANLSKGRNSSRSAAKKADPSSRKPKSSLRTAKKDPAVLKRAIIDSKRSEKSANSDSEFTGSVGIDAIIENLAEHVKSSSTITQRLKIAKSVREVMNLDLTKHNIWKDILVYNKAMKLYTCDPHPWTFMISGNTVEGRGNILLSYETEVFPGVQDEMSVSLPARFTVDSTNAVPRVTSVEI